MFLTPEQILQTAKPREEINRQRMRACYDALSTDFADALLAKSKLRDFCS